MQNQLMSSEISEENVVVGNRDGHGTSIETRHAQQLINNQQQLTKMRKTIATKNNVISMLIGFWIAAILESKRLLGLLLQATNTALIADFTIRTLTTQVTNLTTRVNDLTTEIGGLRLSLWNARDQVSELRDENHLRQAFITFLLTLQSASLEQRRQQCVDWLENQCRGLHVNSRWRIKSLIRRIGSPFLDPLLDELEDERRNWYRYDQKCRDFYGRFELALLRGEAGLEHFRRVELPKQKHLDGVRELTLAGMQEYHKERLAREEAKGRDRRARTRSVQRRRDAMQE